MSFKKIKCLNFDRLKLVLDWYKTLIMGAPIKDQTYYTACPVLVPGAIWDGGLHSGRWEDTVYEDMWGSTSFESCRSLQFPWDTEKQEPTI